MPFAISMGSNFSWDAILSNAPNRSGVYGLFGSTGWIYVGESNDIQGRLLHHINETDTSIKRHGPTGFVFELSPEDQRVNRQKDLIRELDPPCNKTLG